MGLEAIASMAYLGMLMASGADVGKYDDADDRCEVLDVYLHELWPPPHSARDLEAIDWARALLHEAHGLAREAARPFDADDRRAAERLMEDVGARHIRAWCTARGIGWADVQKANVRCFEAADRYARKLKGR